MRSEWSCWRQRAIGEENPAERAVEIYLIGMKKDTEEFPILSGAKPKRTGAPSGFAWSANRGNGDLSSFDGIKKEDFRIDSKEKPRLEMSFALTKDGIVPRSLVGSALVSSFVWFYWFQKNPVGFISETKNGVTHAVAGSSPVVVSLSILGIFLFIFVMTREVRFETFEAYSLKRRFAAFIFDCWYLLLMLVRECRFSFSAVKAPPPARANGSRS